MKLDLRDRVIILEVLIEKNASLEETEVIMSLNEELFLSRAEEMITIRTQVSAETYQPSFTDASAFVEKEYNISDQELAYLKKRVIFFNDNRMANAFNIKTLQKIFSEPYQDEELNKANG